MICQKKRRRQLTTYIPPPISTWNIAIMSICSAHHIIHSSIHFSFRCCHPAGRGAAGPWQMRTPADATSELVSSQISHQNRARSLTSNLFAKHAWELCRERSARLIDPSLIKSKRISEEEQRQQQQTYFQP